MDVGHGREEAEAVGWSLLPAAGRWHCYVRSSVKVALDTRGHFRVPCVLGKDNAFVS